jgi:hypothetical protein
LLGRLVRLGVEDRDLLAAGDHQAAVGRGIFKAHPAGPLDVDLAGRDEPSELIWVKSLSTVVRLLR